jgi:hypothetical protein
MLIETPYKVNDVVSLKLSSGEEIVGKLIEETSDTVTIAKPLMLAQTQQGMGLAPYMFTVDPEKAQLKFNERNIITVSKTMETMAKQYIQSTTGLVT